ncbi:hypothetical protein [Galbibacter sp. PAP.153]|uniref:hypothetical protein n=1 Tax=Galbibacter sp. PAP.153 TaxID=3104623 RepID=UPI00300B3F3F
MKTCFYLLLFTFINLTYAQDTNVENGSKDETKQIIKKYIDEYSYHSNADKHSIIATFEGDYLRLTEMNTKGTKEKESLIFDFSHVYKFQKISKRSRNTAFLNIYVSFLKNEKRDKWDKYKLVLLVKGHDKAEIIQNALKHYNELLLKEKIAN